MITLLVSLLVLERVAKYTGIEPVVLVWIRKKLGKKGTAGISPVNEAAEVEAIKPITKNAA